MSVHTSRVPGFAGAAGMLTLALAACSPPHPHDHADTPLKVISALDCPTEQGDLKRVSAAADGLSCVYSDDANDQITMRLVKLTDGDARAVLAPMEAQLQTEVPSIKIDAATGGPATSGGDHVDINLPGIHIHTNGDGHADVNAMGVQVHANDTGSGSHEAVVTSPPMNGHAGVTVNATEGGARIRVDEHGPGVKMSYILAADSPGPNGYRIAGYEARGPEGGPIVVVTLLGKTNDHDDVRHDIKSLLSRNVGG